MRLLVAAATTFELEHFTRFLKQEFQPVSERHYCRGNLEVLICITGVGLMQTTFALMECIQEFNPHFCLQAGVAGAFNRHLALGELVIIQEEILGDLGAEDHDKYVDMFDLGLINASEKPFVNKKLINTFQDFPLKLKQPFVSSLSVNTVTGSETTAAFRAERFGCDVENMEGAAFHYVCLKKKLPFLQIRSISNYVEARDKSKWKMKEAIENLNQWMISNI
ncbi:MAG: futalosine hydrolase, partial [Sphingobacteriales bacterium]